MDKTCETLLVMEEGKSQLGRKRYKWTDTNNKDYREIK
jgi:hypothetical protein